MTVPLAGFRRAALLLGIGLWLPLKANQAIGQPARATVREYQRPFPTYPFSDPNPIPAVGRIYPYFRFDGFAASAVQKDWKVVELQNEYITVMILPEIGGKIWTAIERKTGKAFIYFNESVKFRDIAMRGPWTSGGIEANYGIIGHTPTVATPVDYVTRAHADGSVTCVIGALDLLTRSYWRLTIRLGRDEAYFTTTSSWYNASPLEEPYYTWMNAAISARNDLQFIYPGTSYLGHDGEHASWPVNRANGRDISWYRNNDFGGYKSYHVFGEATDFFGAYWHDDDFGMVRYAPRDEKPGKKLWIWGLSRQGMIWEDLLTDRNGQYVEVQSGRLFNQTAEQSTLTPFKHAGFAPHVSDRWTEYWYPVVGTGGMVTATPAGALNVTFDAGMMALAFSPAERVGDSLRVYSGSRLMHSAFVSRAPLQSWHDTVDVASVDRNSLRVVLGDGRLEYRVDRSSAALARPLESPADFNWRSAYGLHLRGKEWIRQREYARALAYVDSALAADAHYVPALADRAMLALRQGDHAGAREFARRALAVDTYDGAANYYYGLANRALGASADAKDGFEVASLNPAWRGAAWTELARSALAGGERARAADLATKAMHPDAGNLDALAMLVSVARRAGNREALAAAIARLEAADPLSHLARLERMLLEGHANPAAELRAGVRSELPEQDLIELALWYRGVGDDSVADLALMAAGDHPEALYLRAQLASSGANAGLMSELISRANTLPPRLVFPFRTESRSALILAAETTRHWKPRYYLALLESAMGRTRDAESRLLALGDEPDFAPFYAMRSSLPGRSTAGALRDIERAAALEPAEWRYGRLWSELLLSSGDATGAATVARRYLDGRPSDYILGLTLARALVAGGEYAQADRLLGSLNVLPYEGSGEGRSLYREARLMLAVDAIRERRWVVARREISAARLWPENLGAGKPYPADVDERLEDFLAAETDAKAGRRAAAELTWARIAGDTSRAGGDVLRILSLERLGRGSEALAHTRERAAREPGNPWARWLADRGSPMPDARDTETTVLRRLLTPR